MAKEPDEPEFILHPSLADVVSAAGLNREALNVAIRTNDARKIKIAARQDIAVTDGKGTGVWRVERIGDLFRGDKVPPADIEKYPPEYVPYFAFIESSFLEFCSVAGDKTDQEMEEVYEALLKRPDGRGINVIHDFMWQAAALTLGCYRLSQAEYEGIIGGLLRSARSWSMRPVSRLYIAQLHKMFAR